MSYLDVGLVVDRAATFASCVALCLLVQSGGRRSTASGRLPSVPQPTIVLEDVRLAPERETGAQFGSWKLAALTPVAYDSVEKALKIEYDPVGGATSSGPCSNPTATEELADAYAPLGALYRQLSEVTPLDSNGLGIARYHIDWRFNEEYADRTPVSREHWRQFALDRLPTATDFDPSLRDSHVHLLRDGKGTDEDWCFAFFSVFEKEETPHAPVVQIRVHNSASSPVTVIGLVSTPIRHYEAFDLRAPVRAMPGAFALHARYDSAVYNDFRAPLSLGAGSSSTIEAQLLVDDAAPGDAGAVLLFHVYLRYDDGTGRRDLLVGTFLMADCVSDWVEV